MAAKLASSKFTNKILNRLRETLPNKTVVKDKLSAYIVTSMDAHASEYTGETDKRRAFISGFTGTAGTAVVTEREACMWVDSRYFEQAEKELDKNWVLMKRGVSGHLTLGDWLVKYLKPGDKIGADPVLMTHGLWKNLERKLSRSSIEMVPINTNLIDIIWDKKPNKVANPIKIHPIQYSGQTIHNKLLPIRNQMKENNASYLILTALDEIAWLLNLRGSDVPFNPVFYSYGIIGENCVDLFVNQGQIDEQIVEHLNKESAPFMVNIRKYDSIFEEISKLVEETTGTIWCSDKASFAITNLIPKDKLLIKRTPVAVNKVKKNSKEIQGMKNAHIKDAVALCCFFSWLQQNFGKIKITELLASEQLEEFKKTQEGYVGPSFKTMSCTGCHTSLIHYSPNPYTDFVLTPNCLYLCDCGSQYLEGTTDVSRALHFGNPSDFEKECYTRVLKGNIALSRAHFPSKSLGSQIDSFARKFLWDVGLDYGHSTGHGIGSFLNVHEGPISISTKASPHEIGLEEGMFVTNEPGYYSPGKFGIRIEDVMMVVPSKRKFSNTNNRFLTFETVTLVPKQRNLIVKDLLGKEDVEWLDKYHKRCRDVIGPILQKKKLEEAWNWLEIETRPL